MAPDQTEIPVKKARKVLHFSDGTLEEYSSDEEEEVKHSYTTEAQVDTVSV